MTLFWRIWASQVALVIKNLPANAGELSDVGLISGYGRSPEVGHGSLLQYSCLENSMDRGAWCATVHRVAKSRTRLKQLSTQALVSLLWLSITANCIITLFFVSFQIENEFAFAILLPFFALLFYSSNEPQSQLAEILSAVGPSWEDRTMHRTQ